jgi:hypothetical protein
MATLGLDSVTVAYGGVTIGILGVMAVAVALHGELGLKASALAAGTCLFGVLGGHWLGRLFVRPSEVGLRVVFGMLPRMGIPLAICLVVGYRRGPLYDAGLVFYVLVMYLIVLATDTFLAVRRIATVPDQSKAA